MSLEIPQKKKKKNEENVKKIIEPRQKAFNKLDWNDRKQ